MADRVPSTERPHLHRKVARLLGNTSVPESAELLAVRARHFDGCREYGKAVQALLEGAYLARNEYRIEISREMFQEILRIYRHLASRRKVRREVTNVLRGWFRRDRNWYELLGELSTAKPKATVKIADFGISFRQEDEDRGYQVERRPALGTPRYLSPERIRGEHGGTPCDLFALGIILYEMVTGEPPFPELKRKDLLAANRTEPIRLSSEDLLRFPEGTERLLAHMVEKEPGQRWDAERVVREVGKLQLDLEHDKKR
jgi:serine/threonine protein kinase